jgi:hypothetical protein
MGSRGNRENLSSMFTTFRDFGDQGAAPGGAAATALVTAGSHMRLGHLALLS